MPKSRMCHICGRQTLLAGYAHHIEGCGKLFLAREAQKPKKERRSLPVNPYDDMGGGGNKKSSAEMEALSQQAYNNTLSECAHCGRRFLPEKLVIHQKSCRADKPARRVQDSVNRRPQGSSQHEHSYQEYGHSEANSSAHVNQQYPSSQQITSPSRPKSARRLSADKIVQQYQDSQQSHTNGMHAAPSAMIPAEWSQCQGCGRTFNEIAFAKHTKICDKIFCSKRPEFNAKKHRLKGTEAAQFVGKSKGGGRTGKITGSVGGNRGGGGSRSDVPSAGAPKWKAQSSQLREAMKASRQVARAQKEAERRGVPLASVLPPSQDVGMGGGDIGGGYEDPSFIRCPHCNRTFNEKAAERHIPKCQNIIAKPSFLKAHKAEDTSYHGRGRSSGGRAFGR